MKSYANLDIDMLGYRRADGGEFLRARVASSLVGEQSDSNAPELAFPSRLRERIQRLERQELSFDELILLGEELASLLMPPGVRDFYRRSLDKLKPDQGLRIRIRPHSPELAVLPWEYVYVQRSDVPRGRKGPEGFLALDRKLSIVRYEIMDESSVSIQPMKHHDIRTIALLADVKDASFAELDLDREELNLRQALEGFGGIDTRFLRPGTNVQLQETLNEDAQVFHFSGHGVMEQKMGDEPGTIEGTGQLIFAGDDHRADPVDVATLGLQLRGKDVRLVVLNACEAAKRDPVTPWAGIAPALVRQGIPAVVGMQYTVGDGNAIAFSHRFYQTLASGKSIDEAVSEGRLGILTRSGGENRDWGVPVLYMRSSPSLLFPLPVAPLRLNLLLAAATFFILYIWFYAHIFPMVSDGANLWMSKLGLGGGALAGVFSILKWVGTFAAKTVKSDKGSILEGWLRHRQAKWILKTLFFVSVVLFSTTSSIYLKDDGEPGGTVKLTVLTADDLPFAPLHELTTSTDTKKLVGGPIFIFPPPGKLKVQLEEPKAWSLKEDKKTIRPLPWNPIKFSVSQDFEKVVFRALRVVPTGNLLSYLPAVGDDEEPSYKIKVTINDKIYDDIEDFRLGVLWVGGPEELLNDYINNEDESTRKVLLDGCNVLGGDDDAAINKRNSTNVLQVTELINPGDTITIDLIDIKFPDESKQKTIAPESFLDKPVQTICL